MKLQLSEIAQAVSGRLIGDDLCVQGVSIDTRQLQAGNLYVAIKGHQFDGHEFVAQAQAAGASAILVDRVLKTELQQIIVADTRLALAELAGYWRSKLAVSVVGVTGSNGKTTVKEMLATVLATAGETLSTRGNLNNDIGVPLTLLRLTPEHKFAVIEMGANHPGEIAFTSAYARPEISVITNVGRAHIAGFGDLQGVAKTKAEIVEAMSMDGTAVLNADDEFFPYWQDVAAGRQIRSFGLSKTADIHAEHVFSELTDHGYQTRFDIHVPNTEPVVCYLNLAGEHNVRNALAVVAVATHLGLTLQQITTALASIKPVTGRMQPLKGRKGNIVIDDTYNANPSSLKAAIEALRPDAENWVVLGAFGELGPDSEAVHGEMGYSLKQMPVKRLFATGELARHTVTAFGEGAEYFETQEQLISALNQALNGTETLLVKGSRSQKMENVVASLVDNFRAA